jgi:hypothetical protein
MFETLVSSVIQKLLNNYVEGYVAPRPKRLASSSYSLFHDHDMPSSINTNSMEIAMWSGDVTLRNMVLKKVALPCLIMITIVVAVIMTVLDTRWFVVGIGCCRCPGIVEMGCDW